LIKVVRQKEVEDLGEYGFKALDVVGEFIPARLDLKKKTLNLPLSADPKPYPATSHYRDATATFYVVINIKNDTLDYEFDIET
jgi:hypothetical protein